MLRTPPERFADLPDFGYPPRYADLGDLRLAFVETGPPDGEPVLLLHGEPSWSFLYRKVMPVLADAGLHAIAADLAGFGRSDKPAEIADHSFGDRRFHPRAPGAPGTRGIMTDDTTGTIVTKLSHHSVADTVSVLTGMISAKGMKLFAVIDQSAEARQAGLSLRETTLVVFGSPAAGTPVMAAAPLAALDLPLKVLVWDDGGQTKVTYTAPEALAARYGLSAELAARLAGIGPLTDALVAS